MTTQPTNTPLYSSFRGDPDMDEIVSEFVGELTAHVDAMCASFDTRDWEGLRTIAHQLKGASGGYGFESLGEAAASLETQLKHDERDLDILSREFETLASLCRRASA